MSSSSLPPPSVRETLAPPLGRTDSPFPERLTLTTHAILSEDAAARLTIIVEVEGGTASGRTVIHEGDAFRIGTHPSNDLVLSDSMVSRFHCRVVREDTRWCIEDSGSLNGTRIGELQILRAILPPEAVITIGESTIRIRASDAAVSSQPTSVASFGALTGSTRTMRKLFALIEKVAGSDINCFIHGESGTGKELVATEIVQRGARAEKPFVVVDCGAISPTIIESELFGHVKGAFTGADRNRIGAFEAADGGTVFLDEIGELPLAVQPKLLRALEQRQIRRVGETEHRKVNVRVIAATNRDLEREVNKGSFREDLYFRLAVITLRVPPLRERKEDIPHLVRAFLAQAGVDEQDAARLFSDDVMAELQMQPWTGNVRELRNHVERSIVLQSARMPSMLPPVPNPAPVPGTFAIDLSVPYKSAKEVLVEGFERAYLRAALAHCDGNITKAARIAGIDRMYMHRLVQKHGSREQLASQPDHDPDE